MDRLTSLTVFARVVESAGFSAAARRLNMSTTMVSNHVQSLEDRLGARLLNRTTRKVSLTEVGRVYYERCVQILAEIEEADREAGDLQTKPRGTLRLSISTHIMRFLAPVVSEYLSLYPDVTVDLMIGDRMVDLIEEGFDLIIRITPPPDSSLIVRRLAGWRHFLCGSPGYLETHDRPRQPSDLKAHNCLRYAFYPFEEGWRFIAPDGQTVSVRVDGNFITSSGEALRIAALDGRGLFLAPTFLAADDLAAGRLVHVMGDYQSIEFAILAIYPHRHHLSAKVRGFMDLVARRISDFERLLNPSAPPIDGG